jgi:hypothetical protein
MAILKLIVEGQTLKVNSEIDQIVENSLKYLSYELVTNDPMWKTELTGKRVIVTCPDKNPWQNGSWSPSDTFIHPDYTKAPGFTISVIGFKLSDDKKTIIKQVPTNPVKITIHPSGAV